MITQYMCVKCNILESDVDFEVITGANSSFFMCKKCYDEFINSRASKDLNISEVVN